MDAAGLIVLILFFIGAGVLLYYAVLCFQVRPHKGRQYSRLDLGPLLAHADPDLNGNHEDLQAVDMADEEEPDPSKLDDDSLDNSRREADRLTDVKSNQELFGVDDGLSQSEEQRQKLSDSYEEDGLLIPRSAHISQPLSHSSTQPHTRIPLASAPLYEAASPISIPPMKKHVQFKPVVTQPCVIETLSDPVLDKKASPLHPIGWTAPDGVDGGKERDPSDAGLAEVKVSLPSSCSVVVSVPANESDTDSSEPDVTEYSLESGPHTPAAVRALSDEVSTFSEPKVMGITAINTSVSNLVVTDIQVQRTVDHSANEEAASCLILGNPNAELTSNK